MHGGAVTLARELRQSPLPDLIVATDMLDLTTLLALTRDLTVGIPTLLYMHENQLTYPLPGDRGAGAMRRQAGERDRHYGFINFSSMLAADRVVFNSHYHRAAVLEALPRFLRHFPEHREIDSVARIRERSRTLPVGVEVDRLTSAPRRVGEVPLVLWNQRWEYDKNPADFFAVLQQLADEGLRFRVALCGERFSSVPTAFDAGIEALGERIEHAGFLERDAYVRLLRRADVAVSTSHHEFFGIAVVEAMVAGAVPLLPARLSYPEIVPRRFHATCLYGDRDDLLARLRRAVRDPGQLRRATEGLAAAISERYCWRFVAAKYDDLLDETAAGTYRCPEPVR